MTAVLRKYKFKDPDMLMAASVVSENAMANKVVLQEKRSTWTDEFFATLNTDIDRVIQTCLGIDSAKELRKATVVVVGMHKEAVAALVFVKVQIEDDFQDDKITMTDLLNDLGYKKYPKYAAGSDQEGMIGLLYHFKSNLTKEIRQKLEDKGTSPATLDQIIAFADALKNANVKQETYKGNRSNITGENIEQLNDVYKRAMSICKISNKIFLKDKDLRDLFVFSKIVKALNVKHPPVDPKPAQ